MDMKYLEFFVAVARCGSINRAAQTLYISQPHLSHIIKEMENDVGFTLFQRTNHGVTLTPEGEKFLEHSKTILHEIDGLRQLKRKPEPEKDRLRVSMTKFSHTMESFNEVCIRNQQLDHFSYRLNEGTTVSVIDDVASGDADIGVIHYASHQSARLKNSLQEKGLECRSIASLSPHIVISKNHELIRRNQPVTLSSLRGYGFVRYSGQYEDFFYNIATENQQMDFNRFSRIIYVYGRADLLHLIATSNFFTIGIQNFATQDSMYQITSLPIPDCIEQIEFGIIKRKGLELSDPEQEFAENVTRRYHTLEKEL